MKVFTRSEVMDMERLYRAQFVNSLGGFKSVCLLGTRDPDTHVDNLCIINSVVHIGANPPYLGFIFRPHTVPRHSLENIAASGYYTLSHIPVNRVGEAHQTAAKYDAQVSEFEATGWTPYQYDDFPAPAVGESHLQMGFQLEERHEISLNRTILIIGSLQWVRLQQKAIQPDGFVDLAALDSATNVSLDGYYRAEFVARYDYARPDQAPTRLPDPDVRKS